MDKVNLDLEYPANYSMPYSTLPDLESIGGALEVPVSAQNTHDLRKAKVDHVQVRRSVSVRINSSMEMLERWNNVK